MPKHRKTRPARVPRAEGIGLFRTEHMFYGKNSEQPLFLLRKMIVSKTVDERKAALAELFPFAKEDIKDARHHGRLSRHHSYARSAAP